MHSGASDGLRWSPDGTSRALVCLLVCFFAWLPGAAAAQPRAPTGNEPAGWTDWLGAAVVPGGHRLVRDRSDVLGWIGIAADAALLAAGWSQRRAGRTNRAAYRTLVWRTARGGISPRVDGDFEYYERAARWLASGDFDTDPVLPGIQPETRADTFNGDAWRLARNLFLGGAAAAPGSPEWVAAVEWYAERAYDARFTWDWTGREAERERYRETIAASDEHFRRAGWSVAAMVGLRVASVLDLWISDRSGDRLGIDASLTPGTRATTARLQASIRWRWDLR